MKKLAKKYQEFLFLGFFCLCVFSLNLFYEYKQFLVFKESKHIYLSDLSVLLSYIKTNEKGRTYRVLKLASKDFDFYTTTSKNKEIFSYEKLSLRAITTQVNFKDYLSKSFYMPSYDLNITSTEPVFKHKIIPYFLNQHQDEKIKEFYGALFFALSVSKELRDDVNHYGIAHLIAISGYHIALIFSLLFFCFAPLYGFFQKRYFPYRNLRLDLSVMIFVFLLFYAYLIGFVPSYVRSLVMALFGFYLLAKHNKIIHFGNLFFSVLICFALFPQLLFSVGFLFSVMGVFFIFLYLHHFAGHFNAFVNVVLLNLWTFLAMIIPVLYFFPLISFQQFLAIPLSAAFVVFYPCVLFLHLIGFGGLVDSYLLDFFNFKFHALNFTDINSKLFLTYILLALISIRFKWLALFCVVLNLVPFYVLL